MDAEDEPEASPGRVKLANVATAPKRPPPEKPENVHKRSFVVASFWLVVLLLGLPVWFWTTSIHRAKLPLDDMLTWANGKACKPSFPLHITIEAPHMQEAEATHLVRLTQHALDDMNEFSAHHLRLRLSQSNKPTRRGSAPSYPHAGAMMPRDSNEALIVLLEADDTTTASHHELPPHSKTLRIGYPSSQVPSTTSSSSILSNFLVGRLQELYAEEQAILEYLLASGKAPSGQPAQRQPRSLNPELAAKLANRMNRSLKYAPTYHITISLFTPTAQPSNWDIEAAVAEYFSPFLDLLSTTSNFTVDTQVQLHAIFAPPVHLPEYDEQIAMWTLREEALSGFINAAEWPLSPSIGAGPTLNFVLYVPDAKTSPLVVKESHASNWLIPQWGGVAILNPANISQPLPDKLSKGTIRPALLTFSHQLLAFLGAPQTPPSLPLQLQTLTRVQAASLLLSASSTMGSLANLTVALPSIAIPETVSAAVDTTLTHLRHVCSDLKAGNFQDALAHARIAEDQAEKGFFEKSMVGQVYFPDEHKVAVYLPLLGPIAVPLIQSAFKEIRRVTAFYRGNRVTT